MVASSEVKHRTDLDLINLSKNGDETAFRILVEKHKSIVASTINGMVGNCDTADDIGQEVFIRFYHSMENFRGDSSLSTYLVRIAINLSLNEIKRIKRKKFFSFEKIIENGQDIAQESNSFLAEENNELIRLAMQKLNPKYRSVLVLRLIDGYSTEETANILEIPIGTVLSRLMRAQQKLKEHLQHLK